MSEPKIATIILMIIGILCLYGCVHFIRDTYDFLNTSIETQGVVIQTGIELSDDGAEAIRATFKFEDIENNEYTFRANQRLDLDTEIGDVFDVRYLPDNPEEARLSGNFWHDWGLCIGLGIFGAVFFSGGFFGFRSMD